MIVFRPHLTATRVFPAYKSIQKNISAFFKKISILVQKKKRLTPRDYYRIKETSQKIEITQNYKFNHHLILVDFRVIKKVHFRKIIMM